MKNLYIKRDWQFVDFEIDSIAQMLLSFKPVADLHIFGFKNDINTVINRNQPAEGSILNFDLKVH